MPGGAPYLWPDLDVRTRPGPGRPRLGHHGAMTEFDRLARQVYVGCRLRARSYPVRECLLCILNEEWEHRLYAERDLNALAARR
jgi:hypothetical protein